MLLNTLEKQIADMEDRFGGEQRFMLVPCGRSIGIFMSRFWEEVSRQVAGYSTAAFIVFCGETCRSICKISLDL